MTRYIMHPAGIEHGIQEPRSGLWELRGAQIRPETAVDDTMEWIGEIKKNNCPEDMMQMFLRELLNRPEMNNEARNKIQQAVKIQESKQQII